MAILFYTNNVLIFDLACVQKGRRLKVERSKLQMSKDEAQEDRQKCSASPVTRHQI